MHIPDGYLSPQTTIPAFAVMAPLWGTAFRRVKKTMERKSTPALALCAAFSFLIMMFNVPVVGGSSVHAVGAVFIAVALGPWAAVIAVSAALLIQALAFSDGGVLAYAVNCLNMAVVMPFAGYAVYRAVRGRAPLGGKRGLAAAFAGSYLGLNLAALAAAAEFGVQPLLFHTADGTPLYCPYPLSVSVPSMLFAHLLVAGPIEGAVTAAAVAYLSKFAPDFFQRDTLLPARKAPASPGRKYRVVLLPLAALTVLTPLGLLASGTAWGEWGTDEIRERLGYIPQGLAVMSGRWHALFPDYTLPAPFHSAAGYLFSAAIGALLILGVVFLTSRLIRKEQRDNP